MTLLLLLVGSARVAHAQTFSAITAKITGTPAPGPVQVSTRFLQYPCYITVLGDTGPVKPNPNNDIFPLRATLWGRTVGAGNWVFKGSLGFTNPAPPTQQRYVTFTVVYQQAGQFEWEATPFDSTGIPGQASNVLTPYTAQ